MSAEEDKSIVWNLDDESVESGEVEVKNFDTNITSTVGGNRLQLLSMVQGVLPNERIGRQIQLRGVHVRYNVNIPTGSGSASDTVRIIFVVDKQANSNGINTSDLLNENNYLSFYNRDNEGRFEIISDELISLNTGGASSVNKNWAFCTSLNQIVTYPEWEQEIAIPNTNSMVLVALSKNGFARIDGKVRVTFVDR